MKRLITPMLAIWFVLVIVAASFGAFARPPESPPLPILIAVTAPLVLFAAAYLGSTSFRALILGLDLPLFTAIQAWRAGGLGFLALSANGVLPKLFAWPAGWGDIAIGVTAPWMALALIRTPGFSASRTFIIWNLLGILDLIVAVSTGVLSSGFVPGLRGDVTTAAMAHPPLVLIPGFFVPLYIMLHLAALLQVRRPPVVYASAPPVDHV